MGDSLSQQSAAELPQNKPSDRGRHLLDYLNETSEVPI